VQRPEAPDAPIQGSREFLQIHHESRNRFLLLVDSIWGRKTTSRKSGNVRMELESNLIWLHYENLNATDVINYIFLRQTDSNCNDEIRKEKFICFNDEYKANMDPCLIYSFGKDLDEQFERDMHMFSCEVHAFDKKVGDQKTYFCLCHFKLSSFPNIEIYDELRIDFR